ncbi:MAG: hypothetical protein AAGG02_14835 [Cyanobacteria bacterium P01_H01_bin.15]
MSLPQPTLEPLSQSPRRIKRQRNQPQVSVEVQRSLLLEILLKLSVNVLIAAAAITALTKLLPFRDVQQQKIGEIQTEVKEAEDRLNWLYGNFSRNFDPQQADKARKAYSYRADPHRYRIFLTESTETKTSTSE